MLNVLIICGNPKPKSRTLGLAESLATRLLLEGTYQSTIVDLADYTDQIFAWPSDSMTDLVTTIKNCDLLIVASPTYKATYTGLLKAFFDRMASDDLKAIVAIPVMTGGDLSHSMAPEVNLRPLLVELGATLPTKSLYFVMSDMDHLDDRVQSWVDSNSSLFSAFTNLAPALA